MSVVLPSSAVHARFGFLLSLVFFWNACGTALLLLLPTTAPILLPLAAIVPIAWYWSSRGHLPSLSKPSPVILALALIGVYLLLNATWSLSPGAAYRTVGLFWAMTGILHVLLNVVDDIDGAVVRAMAIGLVVGVVAGGGVLCVEAFTGQGIRRMLMAFVPALWPASHHMVVLADGSTILQPHLINKSLALLTLLFWPAAMVIVRLGLSKWQQVCLLIALTAGIAAILGANHATSKIAFVGALAAYGAYRLYPMIARRLVVAGWVVAVVLVVPLASLAFTHELYRAAWLAPSAQHRVIIWGYTSEQIGKAPFLGAGVATARAVNEPEKPDAKQVPGTIFRLSTSLHSHNAFLQVWYEAGAVGALLLLGVGLLMLQAIARSQSRAQPYLHATFVSCSLMAASSFSIWAPWFLASLTIVAIAVMVGSALPVSATSTQAAT
jgi:O-antigen ligase